VPTEFSQPIKCVSNELMTGVRSDVAVKIFEMILIVTEGDEVCNQSAN
jgi:Cu/Ag efflux pump CusA